MYKYKNVPIETLKSFIVHKIKELKEIHLTEVYELISGNTCLGKPKDHCVDILRNNEAQHPCDPRFGPPFPPHPEKHPNDK